MRLFGDGTVRRQATVAELLGWLGDATPEGFVEPYRRKLSSPTCARRRRQGRCSRRTATSTRTGATSTWSRSTRSRSAPTSRSSPAPTSTSSAPGSGTIDRYLDPPVEFWSLDELLARGEPVEAIFNGPELHNGSSPSRASAPRTSGPSCGCRTSSIGSSTSKAWSASTTCSSPRTTPAAIRSGNRRPGLDDQDARFDRTDQRIVAAVPARRSPAHCIGLSRFLFASNGLPFVPPPRRGRGHARPAPRAGRPAEAPRDRARPADALGRARALDAYFPVQHSFPLTYGIGPAGLPSTATALRRAQAKQLKAYLMVYEQLSAQRLRAGRAGRRAVLARPGHRAHVLAAPFDATQITGYDEIVEPTFTEAVLTGWSSR